MEDESSSTTEVNKAPAYITGWVQSAVETVVQTSFGQTMLKLVDNFLWVVEKSAEWSLPQQELVTEEGGKTYGRLELVRPLPWILFLPGLVILRTLRVTVNVGAMILGYPTIQPSAVVKFVQKSRRHLRAIKTGGLKNLRRKVSNVKDKRLSMNEAKKALIRSIRLTLSTLSCLDGSKPSLSPTPTRIHISALDMDAIPTPEEKSATESVESHVHSEKRKYSEAISSDDSTDESEREDLQSKINRLALDSSTDDPDFNPADYSTSTGISDDEIDLNVSMTEIHDLKEVNSPLQQEPQPANPPSVEIKLEETTEQRMPARESCDKTEIVSDTQTIDSTPYKFSQDGEATFYSPISSKSGTPERSVSPVAEKSLGAEVLKINEIGNGEICFSSGSTISGQIFEETNNGAVVEKRSTNVSKCQLKGKRTSHGNRKKK